MAPSAMKCRVHERTERCARPTASPKIWRSVTDIAGPRPWDIGGPERTASSPRTALASPNGGGGADPIKGVLEIRAARRHDRVRYRRLWCVRYAFAHEFVVDTRLLGVAFEYRDRSRSGGRKGTGRRGCGLPRRSMRGVVERRRSSADCRVRDRRVSDRPELSIRARIELDCRRCGHMPAVSCHGRSFAGRARGSISARSASARLGGWSTSDAVATLDALTARPCP